MTYNKKSNPRPATNLDDQYTLMLWQKSEAQEDVRFYKHMIEVKECAIADLDKQLKETYALIEAQKQPKGFL